MERKSHHSKRPAVNLPDPVPKASYTTEPPKPIILRNFTTEKSYSSKRSSDPKPYLQNGFGSREESDIDKLKSSSISQNDSGRVKSANGDLSQKPPIQHQKPFKRTPEGEDMTDIVSKNIHSGETPENTITAVRNELQNIVHPTVVTVSSGGWMGSSSGGMADIAWEGTASTRVRDQGSKHHSYNIGGKYLYSIKDQQICDILSVLEA